MKKRILKYFTYIFLSLILLLVLVAGITQTPWFKDRLRVVVIQALSSQIKGSLQLGTIRGNFLTGLSIDSLMVYQGDEEILKTGMITLKHDAFSLLKRRISISRLSIVNPEIYIHRSLSGEWNYNALLPLSTDTVKSVFDWKIDIKDLSITGGTIEVIDSFSLAQPDYIQPPPSCVNYQKFSIHGLSVQLSTTYSHQDLAIAIKSAHGSALLPEYFLFSFNANVSANKAGTTIQNLRLVTGQSDVELSGRIKNSNIFGDITPNQLQNDSTSIRLLARKIDFGELEKFFPSGRTLKGSMFVQLDAVGVFGNLNITRMQIQSPKSLIKLSGSIRNLQRPNDLIINAVIGESKIDGPELSAILPKADFLNLEEAGLINTFVQFSGTLHNFTAAVTLKGRMGEVEAKGNVILADTVPKYDLTFSTKAFDIQKFVKTEIPAVFNAHGSLKGEGTDLPNLASTLTIEIDTAQLRRALFTNSQVTISAVPYHLDGTMLLHDGRATASVKVNADLSNLRLPILNTDVTLNSFDLSRILPDSTFRTSLSLKATSATVGKTIDDLGGTLLLDTYDASIKGIDLSNKHLDCSLDQRDLNNRSFILNSNAADAELHGRFDIDIVAAYLTHQIPHLVERLLKHASADTNQSVNRRALATIEEHKEEGKIVDFRYSFNLKDISPVLSLFTATPIDARGKLTGSILGDENQLSITSSDTINSVSIGAGDSAYSIRNAAIALDIQNITRHKTLGSISGNIDFTVETASVHFPLLTDVKGSAKIGASKCVFSFSADIDSTHKISIHGNTAIEPRSYRINLDTLRFSNKAYTLQNAGTVETIIDPSGLTVTHAVINHNDNSLSVSGMLRSNGTFDARALLHNFPLEELNTFFRSPNSKRKDFGFRGKTSAEFHLMGTSSDPIFNFSGTIDSTYYRSTNLGLVKMVIDYKNRIAQLNVTARTTPDDSLPNLEILGTLPIDMAFSGVEKRFPDASQNLSVKSDGFELGLLQWIFPELENLTGKAVVDLHVTGTPRNPDYAGSLSVKTARFTFAPNNIPYIMSGNMIPKGEEITLGNYTIKNVPEEKTGGTMNVNGKLKIKDFNLYSFDLTANGDLLVISDASTRKLTTFYGTIFMETDTGGVRFSGTPDKPFLVGRLNIREASLVFPPTMAEIITPTSQTLPYIIIDDTSKRNGNISLSRNASFTSVDTSRKTRIDNSQPKQEETFLDKLRYDLSIQTQGKTSITMIFTPATNEELYAELDGKINAINDQGTANIYGDISIGSRSYYNFIKRFAATGRLQYVGPWDNPQMNILATYEGYKQNAIVDSLRRSNTQDKVIVELTITGTRLEPKLVMGMKVQTDPTKDPIDWSGQAKGGDVQSDALSFMLTGKFRDELTASDNAAISNVGSAASTSLVSGFTSNLLSGIFTNFLQKEFPFIQSASVSYEGGDPDLRISGEVAKGSLRFGGKVLNDIGNANVSYQLSLGEILNSRSMRNLFIELDHRVEGTYIDESHRNTTTNTARIYYRISF